MKKILKFILMITINLFIICEVSFCSFTEDLTAELLIRAIVIKNKIDEKRDAKEEERLNKIPSKGKPGVTKTFYDDNSPKEIITCDEKGYWISYKYYYENGNLMYDDTYKNGFPIEKLRYYEEGTLASKMIGIGKTQETKLILAYNKNGLKLIDEKEKINRFFHENGALSHNYNSETRTETEFDEQGIPFRQTVKLNYGKNIFGGGGLSFHSETGRPSTDKNGNDIYSNGRPYSRNLEFQRKEEGGIFEEYFDNGQLALVESYNNKKPFGFFAEYTEEGIPIYEKYYARDNTEGYKWYEETNESVEQSKYEGKYKLYSPNGKILTDFFYKNGYFEGIQKKYFWNSDQLMYKGEYKNGRKIGKHIYYTTTGKTLTILDYTDPKNLVKKYFYFSGEPKKFFFYKNGYIVKSIEYYKNGKIKEENFFYPDYEEIKGQTTMRSTIEYYENGQVSYKSICDPKTKKTKISRFSKDGKLIKNTDLTLEN